MVQKNFDPGSLIEPSIEMRNLRGVGGEGEKLEWSTEFTKRDIVLFVPKKDSCLYL